MQPNTSPSLYGRFSTTGEGELPRPVTVPMGYLLRRIGCSFRNLIDKGGHMNLLDTVLHCLHTPGEFRDSLLKTIAMLYLTVRNRYCHAKVVRLGGPVVSLTTHGPRIEKVHYAIETIGRGSLLPSRLILWLDDVAAFHNLPPALQRLVRRGLEVRLCNNYGPHKKYFAYVEQESSFDTPMVTADDDVFYPRSWLKGLSDAFRESPGTINCYFAREIQMNHLGITCFSDWQQCETTRASFRHHAIGMSGIIYPPHFLAELKVAGTGFIDCCPKADDLWLHVQAIRAGYKIRQVTRQAVRFLDVPGTRASGLWKQNLQGGNDEQARKTYTLADLKILRCESVQHCGNAFD